MADAPPPLTAEQKAEAEALYRHLLVLRESGVRQALVTLGSTIGVGQVGRRVDISATLRATN